MKIILQKIKSLSPKNRKLFKFAQAELGEKLTWREKVFIMQDLKTTENLCDSTSVNYVRNNSFMKLGGMTFATMCVTAIVCLSIVLPFTLSKNGKTNNVYIEVPIVSDVPAQQKFFSSLSVPIAEQTLRKVNGVLLFGTQQMPVTEIEFLPGMFFPQSSWGVSMIEHAENEPVLLGYKIIDSDVFIGDDKFRVDYRIRTYKHFYFERYVDDRFSALENANQNHANEMSDQSKLYTFEIQEKERAYPVYVNAFIIDDIKVFTTAFNNSIGKITTIMFTLGNFDYFLTVTEIDVELTTDYLQEHFMPTLFSNIPNIRTRQD